jgi:hypothetical protein
MGNAQGKESSFSDEGTFPGLYLAPHFCCARPEEPWTSFRTFPADFIADYIFLAANLNHFKLLRVVGKGAFGKVRIVERKDTGLTFALKYIRKDEGRSTGHTIPGILAHILCSCPVRKCAEHNTRAADAGTS